jgi:transposase
MKSKCFIGIDVSKNGLDLFVQPTAFYFKTKNDTTDFSNLLQICCEQCNCKVSDLFFCFENTGRYSRLLAAFFTESGILFSMVPAMEIKKSLGLKRGKSDRTDAKAIALYACQHREELQPTKMNSALAGELRQLLTLRDKLIRHRTAYKNSISDLTDVLYEGETDFIRQLQNRMISSLNVEIRNVDERIEQLIATSDEWLPNYRLIQTVRGIGPVLAKYMIIYTENFTRINNPKSFACYAGIAPFEYSSGSSVKGRTRVHPCANKQLKSLLNTAAMCAIQLNGEYKTYYQRRTLEEKNKMSTLNIIRNKLVSRVYAVARRQTPYVDLSKFAA